MKSNTAGRHLVLFRSSGQLPGQGMCRKTGDGTLWVGRMAPSPSGSPPGLCPLAGVSPMQGNPREAISPRLLYLDSQLRQIDSVCLLLVITLMKQICWGYPSPEC